MRDCLGPVWFVLLHHCDDEILAILNSIPIDHIGIPTFLIPSSTVVSAYHLKQMVSSNRDTILSAIACRNIAVVAWHIGRSICTMGQPSFSLVLYQIFYFWDDLWPRRFVTTWFCLGIVERRWLGKRSNDKRGAINGTDETSERWPRPEHLKIHNMPTRHTLIKQNSY